MNDEHVNGGDKDLWKLEVKGIPNVAISFGVERPEGIPGRTSAEQMAVAGTVVNAIPTLIEAPAGLVSLPLATPFEVLG